ncbi:MAG: hypothetical protein SF051_01420 [Elusimicrobiota bacterium]|nr:hypothetical protein [Elusimicrobiota bacterium]
MNAKTSFVLAVLSCAAVPAGASAMRELLSHVQADAVAEVVAPRGAPVVLVKGPAELPVVKYTSFNRYAGLEGASYDAEVRAGSLRRHGYLVVDHRVLRKSCGGRECYAYQLEFRPRGSDAGARLPRVVSHTSPAEYGSLEAASYALERRKGAFRDEGFIVLDDGVLDDACFGSRDCRGFRIDMVAAP